MTNKSFKDHFSKGSADYATYRPSYPIELVEQLAAISPSQQRALDCGCGTGQLSTLLAKRFHEVIATDASDEQIKQAKACKNVIYRTALAENSGLDNATVDLITVAQAAHWLDLEKFYSEVWRIAKPEAVIALITYGVLHVEGDIDRHIQDFYYNTIASFWPIERRHVEDGYSNLPFPFQQIELPQLNIEVQWNLQQLIGYIKTWSALKAAEKALGTNPIEQILPSLQSEWGDPTIKKQVTWPLSIRAGRIFTKSEKP